MALLLGMAMLPAGAIAMQVGLNAVRAQEAAQQEMLGRQAVQSLQAEQDFVHQLRELTRALAASPSVQHINAASCRRWLHDVRSQYAYISVIAVTSENGEIVCSDPLPRMRDPTIAAPLRQTARERDDFVMAVLQRSQFSAGPVLGALEPIHDPQQRRRGFVGLAVPVASLQNVLDKDRGVDAAARAAIVDGDGRIVAQASRSPASMAPALPTPAQLRGRLGTSYAFIELHRADAVVVPLQAPDLYGVMSWTRTEHGWRTWLGYGFSVAAPLLIWMLAVAAGWFAIEIYVARPLSSLEAAARSFARGEEVHDAATLISAPIEIRSLRRTLAAMAKTLRGREARLMEALSEERALLREVHHRVKNNLQMVASLLSIQSRAAKDEAEAWGLARAHDRVQLLSQVHQRIYASGEVREVRLDELTGDIARQMVASRGILAQNIQLQLHMSEARVTADRAVPLAFLIGESVSTALDMAPDQGPCRLDVYLRQEPSGALYFAIDGDMQGATAASPTASRLIDAFGRQLGAQIGRHPERPYMIWAYIPPELEDRDEEKAAIKRVLASTAAE